MLIVTNVGSLPPLPCTPRQRASPSPDGRVLGWVRQAVDALHAKVVAKQQQEDGDATEAGYQRVVATSASAVPVA